MGLCSVTLPGTKPGRIAPGEGIKARRGAKMWGNAPGDWDKNDSGAETWRFAPETMLWSNVACGSGRAANPDDILCVKTYYEQMWLSEGKPITYLAFRL